MKLSVKLETAAVQWPAQLAQLAWQQHGVLVPRVSMGRFRWVFFSMENGMKIAFFMVISWNLW